ncbi:MAG: PAS domain-containing protein [Hyphomicrobiaceae bacterium]
MKLPTTRMLYSYWNDVRGRRLAPSRFEIDPSRIGPILSETFILERGSGRTFPFRLAGTRICEQLGRELRGTDFLSLVGEDRRVVNKALDAVTNEGAALVIEIDGTSADGRSTSFEAILLPLVHPAAEVTRYLGALAPVDPPAWQGVEPIVETTLAAHDVIWPEGRSFSFSQSAERQLPFVPELAAARVVRSARRQFRILDGGRKE